MTLLDVTVDIQGSLEKFAPQTQFTLGKFIGGLAGVALIAAGAASFGFFVLGGLRWVLSGGEKGKIEEAQHMITSALVGLSIVAASFAIFSVIQYLFGIDIVKL